MRGVEWFMCPPPLLETHRHPWCVLWRAWEDEQQKKEENVF